MPHPPNMYGHALSILRSSITLGPPTNSPASAPPPAPSFEIYPCGDPHSRAWDCSETDDTGTYYRGDISGRWSKQALLMYIRTNHPGCNVSIRK